MFQIYSTDIWPTAKRAVLVIAFMSSFPVHILGIESASQLNWVFELRTCKFFLIQCSFIQKMSHCIVDMQWSSPVLHTNQDPSSFFCFWFHNAYLLQRTGRKWIKWSSTSISSPRSWSINKSKGESVFYGDFSLCAIIKYRNPLCASEKIQRSSAPLLQLFRVLHTTSVSLGSNAVKLQVWKDENALKFKYVINFF